MVQGSSVKKANVVAKGNKEKKEKREAKVQGINKKPKKNKNKSEMQKIKSQLNKSMGAKIEREMMAKLKKEGKPLHVLKDTSTAAEQKAPTFSGKFVNKKTLSKKK